MDILLNPSNDSLIGAWCEDWGGFPERDDLTGSTAALTALTLGAEHIVLSGEKYMAERDLLPEAAVLVGENCSAAVTAGVQAAALEAALVGNLLAVLADVEAWAHPIGLS